MEFHRRKTGTPLGILLTFTLILLQLWNVTAQTKHNESSTSETSGRYLSSSSPRSLISFRFRWGLTKRHRNKVNRASREYLYAHNVVRASVGEPPLEWDGRLAAYARGWANKRVGDCRLLHSDGPFGENIFWAEQNNWKPRDVVKVWADEYKYYDVKENKCEPDQMCGHYTQIVWRDSTKVGCAHVNCLHGGVYSICVYNPPGNFEGEHPFGSYEPQVGLHRHDPPAVIAGISSDNL